MSWTVAAVFALGATCVAWARLHHVRLALRFDPSEVAKALDRDRSRAHLRELVSIARKVAPGWEVSFWDDLLEATTEEQRTAAANEHLSDLAHELDWGSALPTSAARIGLLGPMCVVFFSTAAGHGTIGNIVPIFAWCVVGVLGPLSVGRAAQRLVTALRAGVDLLVARSILATHSEADPLTSRPEFGLGASRPC